MSVPPSVPTGPTKGKGHKSPTNNGSPPPPSSGGTRSPPSPAGNGHVAPNGGHAVDGSGTHWVATWTSMQQQVEPGNMPPSPFSGSSVFRDATIRQTVHVSIGASRIRVQISNVFGSSPLPISAATVALTAGNRAGVNGIETNTLQALTFGGSASTTVAAGSTVYSDPVGISVKPASMLSISLFSQAGQSGSHITGHPGSRTTSWMQSGNHVNASTVSGAKTEHWYWLSAVEAWAPASDGALMILGDSITDGRGSTDNANNRWPDLLVARLQKNGHGNIGVNNQAAGGNAVLRGGLGPPLLQRYKRDALQQQGVKWVLVFEGVNDIGASGSAEQLISAFTTIVKDCKAAGLKVFGATIPPFKGNSYSSSAHEATREKVNHWILTSKTYDAVVDFSKMISQGDALGSRYNSGDGLHPSVAGYQAMADGFPLDIFK
ncbi:SGNH hydrolase [Microthyrium microscopicum]|uniref:SGNH hydrolase n=1 Tax=Microthyrium microscopicum TaxID=703497 RepID=A0A6A6TTU6_9PEZI|nr:SGNH hydrolase [Microthyrium microscopicum]